MIQKEKTPLIRIMPGLWELNEIPTVPERVDEHELVE